MLDKDNIIEKLKEYRYMWALGIVMAIMTSIRVQSYSSLQKSYGIVFSGNDPWYHFRSVMYVVNNWPSVMKTDPLSGYPEGASPGTFGTIFDQLIATIALLLGLGSPSEELVKTALALYPVLLGVLIAIPTYFITKRFTGSRKAGLFSSIILAFQPGSFLSRSVAGVSDHHIAEVLLLMCLIYYICELFDYFNEEVIIYEFLKNESLRENKTLLVKIVSPVLFGSMYLLMWPPSTGFIGLILATAIITSVLLYTKKAIEPNLISVATFSVVLASVSVVFAESYGASFAEVSGLDVLVYLSIAVVSILTIALKRLLDKTDNRSRVYFVVSAGVLASIGFVFLYYTNQSIIVSVIQIAERSLGLGSSAVGTIGEQQALSLQQLVVQYGLTIVFGIVGMGLYFKDCYSSYQNDSDFVSKFILVSITAFILVATFRVSRFGYYLAPLISIFTSILYYRVFSSIDLPDINNIKIYHGVAFIIAIGLLVPYLAYPVNSSAIARGDSVGTASYNEWHDSLEWMSENTPEIGLSQYESVKDTGDYTYSNDTYGVMSWWDYGHWITVTGERVPVANPFQQNANVAADYLLADNISEAEESVDISSENESIRYVAIDWQMVSPNSKFSAPVVFHDNLSRSDMYNVHYRQTGGGINVGYIQPRQRYYESLMIRLWYGHGGRMEPGPYVVDYERTSTQGATITTIEDNSIKTFDSVDAAREYAESETTATLSGVGRYPNEPVEALDHFRLVKASSEPTRGIRSIRRQIRASNNSSKLTTTQNGRTLPDFREFNSVPSAVKIYERVPGAKVKGVNAPANSTVRLGVSMRANESLGGFSYTKRVEVGADGNFTTTVPYSTVGNSDITAESEFESQGPYRVTAIDSQSFGTFNVSETDVLSDDSQVDVTVEMRKLRIVDN